MPLRPRRNGSDASPVSALTTIETKISSILKAIEDGMYHASMKAKMSELEA